MSAHTYDEVRPLYDKLEQEFGKAFEANVIKDANALKDATESEAKIITDAKHIKGREDGMDLHARLAVDGHSDFINTLTNSTI